LERISVSEVLVSLLHLASSDKELADLKHLLWVSFMKLLVLGHVCLCLTDITIEVFIFLSKSLVPGREGLCVWGC
jgi:hypothetical protein